MANRWYIWRVEGREGMLRAPSPTVAAARALKHRGILANNQRPIVRHLEGHLYEVRPVDGPYAGIPYHVEVFEQTMPRVQRDPITTGGVGDRVAAEYLSDREVKSLIARYLRFGGTPEGAEAIWQTHERYKRMRAG